MRGRKRIASGHKRHAVAARERICKRYSWIYVLDCYTAPTVKHREVAATDSIAAARIVIDYPCQCVDAIRKQRSVYIVETHRSIAVGQAREHARDVASKLVVRGASHSYSVYLHREGRSVGWNEEGILCQCPSNVHE